jgi:hypothetical protein
MLKKTYNLGLSFYKEVCDTDGCVRIYLKELGEP